MDKEVIEKEQNEEKNKKEDEKKNIIEKKENENQEEKQKQKKIEKDKKENLKKHKKENSKKEKKQNPKLEKEKEKNPDDSIALWKIWTTHPPITLNSTSYSLMGYSIAALRTNFYIKELGLMLDAGLSIAKVTINHMLITHCHSDHIATLPFHIYSYKENEKIKIYIPKGIEKHIKDFIEITYLLSSHTFPEEEGIKREDLYLYNFYELIIVEPGMILDINIKKNNFGLEIFKCYHQVPCVGYGIFEKRKKLKEEYVNLKGKEIGELRKKGIEINYEYQFKFLCYLGDTSKDIFNNEQWEKITQYKNIVIECTFIKDDDLEQADKTFHIHWKFIEPIIDKYKDNIFILIHFSQRYDNSELIEFFNEKNRNNVIPWIN